MEKIGGFSKQVQSTIKTLRHYDRLGLLVPDYIDLYTNYRHYRQQKAEEMRRITDLKEIGFSLHEIKIFLDGNSDKQQKMIEEKQSSLKHLAERTNWQLE